MLSKSFTNLPRVKNGQMMKIGLMSMATIGLGIRCKDDSVVGLNLTNNGLSGQLTTHVSSLPSLEVLDLSDNDIKVSSFVRYL